MLICISTIVPKVSYYQGRCRQQGVLATTPLDFLNGDFDQLGVQSIDLQEVFADAKSPAEFNTNWNNSWSARKVWGFTQRYQEWKTGYDILSGDYRVPTLRAGADSYHLFREIFPSGKSYDVTQGQYQYFTSITPTFCSCSLVLSTFFAIVFNITATGTKAILILLFTANAP